MVGTPVRFAALWFPAGGAKMTGNVRSIPFPVNHVPNASWHPGNSALFAAEAIRRAGSADAGKLIPVMEGMVYEGPAGKMTMRGCDHQIQADGWIAMVKADHQFKNIFKFPYLAEATRIPVEKISVAPKDTGNPRCK